MTDSTNPYAAAAAAHYAPLGAQVNNWVDQSAQNIPALQPMALNPGMGGPIHGQQAVSGYGLQQAPAVPGGAPAVALPPTAAAPTAATPVNTQFPLNPDDQRQKPDKFPNWQEAQQANPGRFAHILPMVQQLMQRRGFPFRAAPPQATTLHNAVMPNPTPVA